MSIELDDFHKDFFQAVVGFSETGAFMEHAFTEVYCSYLVDAGEFDTFDSAYYKAVKGLKVDGYAGDPEEFDGVLTLVISDFSDSSTPESLTKTQVEAIFNRLLNFYRACLEEDFYIQMEESSSGYGLAQLVNMRQASLTRVRLFLVSNRILSGRISGMDDIEVGGKPVSFNVWDISRLHRLVASGKGKEDIEIDLEAEFGKALPCLPAHVGGDAYESYLAVVPGTMLADLYARWGARLLEQNVRCFLQARGNVNKGIRNTVLNDPDMFFAYNNGITATAESLELSRDGEGTGIKRLRNLQIVNGGQTTASIFSARKKDKASLDHIFVQMKLSVVAPSRAESVVPKISEYANSQNRVNAADFFANHPFHVRMEEISRRLWARSPDGTFRDTKWFYERARGQYLDAKAYLTAAKKKQFDSEFPKAQSFTKTDLAKFENVWELVPHIVSKGAQSNFAYFAAAIGKKWETDSDQFNDSYFKSAMARALIFKRTEKLVSSAVWYEGGYRANIVAYTIAKLAELVRLTGKSVDFLSVWENQKLSPAMEEAIVQIAEATHPAILETPPGMRNISEWAKKESCWNRVLRLPIQLPPEFTKELISMTEIKREEKEAKKVQKVDNGIEAQRRVLELGSKFWADCLEWVKKEKLFTEKDHDILAVAAQIPHKLPSEKQSVHLTQLLDDLIEEACPVVAKLERA